MKSFLASLIFLSFSALAYIPSADFIVSRTVKNSGQGVYQIKKDIQFPLADKTISITETWWTSGPDTLFLKAESLLFTQYFLYKNGKRFSFNSQGQMVSSTYSPFFIEPFFLYRNSQDFKSAILQKRLAPQTAFKKRPVFKNNQELAKWSEPYLSLSRFKGAVTYLLGFAAEDAQRPGIWIEQDRFIIRKIKLDSDVEVSVDTISELSRGLIYPKTMTYSWQTNSIQADLTRGDALKSGTEFFNESEFAKLANQNKELPAEYKNTVVEEFYKRFR